MTRLCIFGAGAIGGHLAVRLAASGVQTSVVVRTPAQAEAIRRDGLTLLTDEGETIFSRPEATADPSSLPRQDLVLITAKAHSLPAAVEGLKSLARPDVPFVYFLNGIPWWYHFGDGRGERSIERLDPGCRLWREVGAGNAVGGIAYSANAKIDAVTIRGESRQNRFIIGEPAETGSDRLHAIADVLRNAGLDVVETPVIRGEIWRKLLGNMANSPLACLTGLPGFQLASDPDLCVLYTRLFAEGKAVAAALGHIVTDTAEERLERLKSIHHRTSMLQDLEAGRPIEIDAQLLAVQDLARLTGISTPVLDTLLPVLAAVARAKSL